MTNTITFWTPVIWPERYTDGTRIVDGKNWMGQACNFTENFFHWQTRDVATVLEVQSHSVHTRVKCQSPICWHTALKVACCFTLVIPAIVLLVKAVRRYLDSSHYIAYQRTIRKENYTDTVWYSKEGALENGIRIYNNKAPVTIQYINPKIIGYIHLEENRFAIAKVRTQKNGQVIAAVRALLSSLNLSDPHYLVYSPVSLNEVLWKIGCRPFADFFLVNKNYFGVQGIASLNFLDKLAFEPSFDVRGFYDFLFQSDAQGNFPIDRVTQWNQDFLLKFFKDRGYLNPTFKLK